MKSSYGKKPDAFRDIARERIIVLFQQAERMFGKDRKLADRYVALARKIGMKYKVRISSAMAKKFCRHCYSFLMPSVNVRIRLAGGKVVYYCLNCKHHMRFPYVREQKAKRAKK